MSLLFSYNYQNAFENAFRFRLRSDIHLADNFVDTDSFSAEFAAVSQGETLNDQGLFVQTGYFLIPKRLEIAGRYEIIDFDNDHPEAGLIGRVDNKTFYTAGLTYFFHGRRHKIQLNYIHREEELSGAFFGDNDENIFLTQYQIYF